MPRPRGCCPEDVGDIDPPSEAEHETDVDVDVVEGCELWSAVSLLDPIVDALVMVTSLLFAAFRAADSPSHTGQSTFLVWVS